MQQQQPGGGRKVLSFLWALMPLYTFGLLAPVPFIHAAIRLRTLRMWLTAVAYGLLWLLWLILISVNSGVASGIATAIFLVLVVAGTIHAFTLRRAVFALRAPGYQAVQPVQVPTVGRQIPTANDTLSDRRPDELASRCARIRAQLDRMSAYVRTHPGAVPSACEHLIDNIAASCERVVASALHDRREGAELRSVEEIATSYLPESIAAYTRLQNEFALTHMDGEGRTPADELESQLKLMSDAARAAVDSLAEGDTTRLREQSAFLRGKFRNSELDLP